MKPSWSRTFAEKLMLTTVVIAAGIMGLWTWQQYIQPALTRPPTSLTAEQLVPKRWQWLKSRTNQELEILSHAPRPAPPPVESLRVVYHAAELRHPFASVLPETQTTEETGGSSVTLPPLALQGIIWGEVEPQAIIDRKVVKAGDAVGGAEVVSIDQDGVMLLYRGRTFLLKSVH